MRKVPTLGLIVVGAALAVSASAKPQPAVAGDTKLQNALDELVAAGAPARSRSSATATARSATPAATET